MKFVLGFIVLYSPLQALITQPLQWGVTNGGLGMLLMSQKEVVAEVDQLPDDTLVGTLESEFMLEYTSLANGNGSSGFCGVQFYEGGHERMRFEDYWNGSFWGAYKTPVPRVVDSTGTTGADVPFSTNASQAITLFPAARPSSGGFELTAWDEIRVTTTREGMSDDAPIVKDDQASLRHQGKVRFRLFDNDEGPLNPASLTILTPPAYGTVVLQSDGFVLYSHTSGTPSSDTFAYQVSNPSGSASDTGSVTLHFPSDARLASPFYNIPFTAPSTALSLVNAYPHLSFDSPHGFSAIPGHPDKLLVTEGDGRIYLLSAINTASPSKLLVLDIRDRVLHDNGERALKGIAAHPDWSNNGSIFVTYNSKAATVRLSRFDLARTAPFAAGAETILINQASADIVHNIGTCRFGSDNYLYVSFGDEGTQNDGYDNSQHIDKDLWSCIIRIDVDKKEGNLEPNADRDIPRDALGKAYFSIPFDNPFVGATSFNGVAIKPTEVRTEMVVVGLRNPWAFSLEDHDANGTVDEIWVADVGRNSREEISAFTFGQNGGWAWREGTTAGVRSGQFINGAPQSAATLVVPKWEYGHGGGSFQGHSVTGGFIYRGKSLPEFTGKYLFADYVSGNIWTLDPTNSQVERIAGEVALVGLLEDPATGDVLLLDRGNTGGNQGEGSILRLTLNTSENSFPSTLSQTNFFADLSDFTPNPGGHFYEPNLSFWSDFSVKSRWFSIPATTDVVTFQRDQAWDYPAGMIFVKHFDYPTQWESFTRQVDGQSITDRRPLSNSPKRRIETRLLVKNTSGSYGVSYQWDNINTGVQNDATLASHNGSSLSIDITLDGQPTSVPWEIPSRSSCVTCHTPEAGHALSFNTRQLNSSGSLDGVSGNFIKLLTSSGYLTGFAEGIATLPRHVRPDETQYSLEARARSYLDVNCAYCHQSSGTGGGNWDGTHALTLAQTGMVNGHPVDAPISPEDRLLIPGVAHQSIIYNRAAAANGYSRMPPLATNEVDWEGAQLIADWINNELTAPISYDQWRLSVFGDGTSAQGNRLADPDGDGATNEYEWLTQTDPLDSKSQWQTALGIGSDRLILTYPPLRNRSIRAEHSMDLVNWAHWEVPGNDGIPLFDSGSLQGQLNGQQEFFRFTIEER